MIVKKKLKRIVLPTIVGLLFVSFIATTFIIRKNMSEPVFNDDTDFNYATENIFSNDMTTVNSDVVILKPFSDSSNVKVSKYYYDYKAEKENQQNALILYENTYMQNSGIDYTADKQFEVATILDGVVLEVGEDKTLGKFVEIRHSNDMISIYQSLSEVTVKKDDEIKQGYVIGKSGKNNINPKQENQLHFELSYKGEYVNPEDFFDKKVQDL